MRLIWVFLLALVCLGCGASSVPQTPEAEKQWFNGGTLHKANGTEWLGASRENQLATAADFVSAVNPAKTTEEFALLKPKASNLATCITETLTPPAAVGEEKWAVFKERPVIEMAAACTATLGYSK